MKMLDVNGIGMTSQRTRNRLVNRLRASGIQNEKVLEVIRQIPRHLFVDEALASRSYEDTALPIGYSQTISQPWVVARMTELLLKEKQPEKVLEIGTGSGYQAAVLARLVTQLYTIEIIEPLYQQTRQLLQQLNYQNIQAYLSDGRWGREENAPYDAIIVTAAPEKIPQPLLQQLAIGGQLLIPVGCQYQAQYLQQIIRQSKHGYTTKNLDQVQFVPLTHY